MKPKRIQRRRIKGRKMPPNTVYVGRPSKWGNPFKVTRLASVDLCMRAYRNMVRGIWDGTIFGMQGDRMMNKFYTAHHKWLERINEHPTTFIQRELRGKNLACWCKLSEPCHADILLELANEKI